MQGPRADYICERCDPEGQSPFEGPVAAARCSACGRKKWLRRLYNAINISSGLAKTTDRMVEPAYTAATAGQDAARRAERQNGPALAVPLAGIGGALARLGLPAMKIGAPDGKARAIPRAPSDAFAPFQQQTPRPHVIARDTEWAVTKRADGTLAPARQ